MQVNCNTCNLPGLRISKEALWGLGPYADFPFPENRLGLAAERTQEVWRAANSAYVIVRLRQWH